MPGLELMVGKRSARWAYSYKVATIGGRVDRQVTIGTPASHTVREAREAVEILKGPRRRRRGPGDRRRRGEGGGLAAKAQAADRRGRDAALRPRRRALSRRKGEEEVAALGRRDRADAASGPRRSAWAGRDVRIIAKRDVIALVDTADAERGTQAARKLLSMVRTFLSWASGKDWCRSTSPPTCRCRARRQARPRAVGCEIAAIWHATASTHPFDRGVRVLLLSGQRRDEVFAMPGEEVDLPRPNG